MPAHENDRSPVLIAAAGLESVFARFPEDVTTALAQGDKYNQAIAEMHVVPLVPGSGELPGQDR